MVSIKRLQQKRKALCVVQWFFFSALGCIYPFLSTHMVEIGLTETEAAQLNSYAALASILGPLLLGPIAHRFNKYQTTIVIALVGSLLCYTSLLLIPQVIRTPRHPNIIFDCSSNTLRMERCSHWDNSCHMPQKAARGNFTNFTLTKCKYVCPTVGPVNNSTYPMHVCFISSSEGNLCMMHDPADIDKGIMQSRKAASQLASLKQSSSSPASTMPIASNQLLQSPASNSFVTAGPPAVTLPAVFTPPPTKKPISLEAEPSPILQFDHLVQFDSRFDRWPLSPTTSKSECAFQSTAPLIVNHRPYESVQCRPYVHNCYIHCKVNLLHRPKNTPNALPRPPAPCFDLLGNPKITYYSYLIVRCLADMFLFAAYCLIDALGVNLMSNYDSLYGGWTKLLAIVTPLILFPTLSGTLVDYYSHFHGRPDYSPAFVIFDGLILITITLVISVSATPVQTLSQSGRFQSQSQTSLRSSPSLLHRSNSRSNGRSRRGVDKSNRIRARNWWILILWLLPVALISGAYWGILQAYLQQFYLQLGATRFWLGFSFSFTYLCLAPFTHLAKPLISGIGRLHLIALGFVFYALRLTGASFLSKPRWTLLPFEAMEAFTLPLAWLGICSYGHQLIASNQFLVDGEPISRSTLMLNGQNSDFGGNGGRRSYLEGRRHLVMQYLLNIVHFGLGRALGTSALVLWLQSWDDLTAASRWEWINKTDLELPELDAYGFRIALRLMAIGALSIAGPFLILYHGFSHVVHGFTICLVGLKECGLRCRACCRSACNALCCCSCKITMCRICRDRKSKKEQEMMSSVDSGEHPTPSSTNSRPSSAMGSSQDIHRGHHHPHSHQHPHQDHCSTPIRATSGSTSFLDRDSGITGCGHPSSLNGHHGGYHRLGTNDPSDYHSHHSPGSSSSGNEHPPPRATSHHHHNGPSSLNGSAVAFEMTNTGNEYQAGRHHHHSQTPHRHYVPNGGHHHHHHRQIKAPVIAVGHEPSMDNDSLLSDSETR